jgi:hypothetical protein
MRTVGTAMMAWLTDASTAAAGQSFDLGTYETATLANVEAALVTQYIQEIPARDGWKHPFDFYLDTVDPSALNVMAIRSAGRDGAFSGDTYTAGAFDPLDYDQDIVWADGVFIRWPQRLSS